MTYVSVDSLLGGALQRRVTAWLTGFATPQQVFMPAEGASLTVHPRGDDVTVVPVFPNGDGSGVALTQPLTADSDGRFPGYVQLDELDFEVSGPGVIARTFPVGFSLVANYQRFTNTPNAGTVAFYPFTVPPGVSFIRARVTAGGAGGGGGGGAGAGQVGGAGGCAGAVTDLMVPVTPGQNLGMFVGFGGAGGVGSTGAGVAGGTSGSGQDSGITATDHGGVTPAPPSDYIAYAVGAIAVAGGGANSVTTVQSRQWGNAPTAGGTTGACGSGGQATSLGGILAPACPGVPVNGGGGGGAADASHGGGGGGGAIMPGWTGAGGVNAASANANGVDGGTATTPGCGGGGGGGASTGGHGGAGGKGGPGLIELWL